MDYINNKEIEIIVSEFDGVLTDGTAVVDTMGNIVGKSTYLADFEAINNLKRNGYKFVVLSSDSYTTHNLLRSKNIPFYNARTDKLAALHEILRRYDVRPCGLLYVGSKPTDYQCMALAEVSVCPNTSITRRENTIVLPCAGGAGVISHLAWLLRCYT